MFSEKIETAGPTDSIPLESMRLKQHSTNRKALKTGNKNQVSQPRIDYTPGFKLIETQRQQIEKLMEEVESLKTEIHRLKKRKHKPKVPETNNNDVS